MVLEWSDIKVDYLISLVKDIPALYDVSSLDYCNKDKKEKLWESLGKKLGITARNCRRKWTGLCIKYNKCTTEGTIVENGEEWPWFEKLKFIDGDAEEKGGDDNAKTSNGSLANIKTEPEAVSAEMPYIQRKLDVYAANLDAMKDMLVTLEGSMSSLVVVPSHDNEHANGDKTNAPSVNKSTPSPEGSVSPSMESSETLTNVNANKLFFESLINDLSSLSQQEQYSFKVEVLVLLKGYLCKHKN